ncbi:MAG: GspH/FimT family pseudopilin [Pseudomonadota bacterium]
MSPRTRPRGFTLTELMIVVTVMAVLMAVALPNFTIFVRNQRVKTASFDVFSSLVFARSEAVTRNAAVTMAPVTAGTWTSGWTVQDSGGTVLRSQDAVPGITFTTGPASVVYAGSGRLSAAVNAFELTATGSGITTRCVSIDLSGRPVTKAAAC